MTVQLGRFQIRDLHPWEGAQVFAMTGDPVVMRYMGFPLQTSVDEATALIERYRESPTRWQAVCLGDDVIGVFGLEVRGHQATLSLMFRRDRKARGAGRELAVPLVQWIFTHPTIWRVWSYVHYLNVPGQRVTERTGALKEGRLRRFEHFPNVSTEPQDCYIYSIVRG